MCVCVCIFYIVTLEPLSTFLVLIADNIFHLDVHYMCCTMLVRLFEPQGKRITNVHYYYYLKIETYSQPLSVHQRVSRLNDVSTFCHVIFIKRITTQTRTLDGPRKGFVRIL